MSHAERDGCSGIECIDVEPLACSPVGPVIDPFEDLPALKMDDEQGPAMGDELTQEQREALARFKEKKGSYWKSRLVELWISGRDDRAPDGAVLRQVRNTLGLDGLARVKI